MKLCDGCKYCFTGEKSVLFITGICPRNCYYCPLSEKKYQHDVIYVNERKVDNIKEIVEEVRISKSKGCGITGGDPLAKLDRTVEVINF